MRYYHWGLRISVSGLVQQGPGSRRSQIILEPKKGEAQNPQPTFSIICSTVVSDNFKKLQENCVRSLDAWTACKAEYSQKTRTNHHLSTIPQKIQMTVILKPLYNIRMKNNQCKCHNGTLETVIMFRHPVSRLLITSSPALSSHKLTDGNPNKLPRRKGLKGTKANTHCKMIKHMGDIWNMWLLWLHYLIAPKSAVTDRPIVPSRTIAT